MDSLASYFKRQLTLTHIFGVPVRVDRRWLPVFVLMTIVASSNINTLAKSLSLSILLGIAATFLFFASILAHELMHAFAAWLEGVEVAEIVLHPFGGLTRFRREPNTARAELIIAIAGPAASFLIGIAFAAMTAAAAAIGTDILAALFLLLSVTNILLAIFNMFPGYPLDGGRVLRAYMWKNGRDPVEATIIAGLCGQYIAATLIVIGIFIVFRRNDFFTGFWAATAGLFLFDSARSIVRSARAAQIGNVEDVMRLPTAISPDWNLQQVVDGIVVSAHHRVLPVAVERRLYGMLLLEDIRDITRDKWRTIRVAEVMRPLRPDYFVETGTPVSEARALMSANEIRAIAVVDADGKLVGLL